MPIGVLFWVLMVFMFIFGMYWGYNTPDGPGRYGVMGSSFLVFILLALLGWKVFGPVLQ